MGQLVDAILRRATRAGFRRALAGEHWAWLLVAAAAYVIRRARRPDVRMQRIQLRPGDRYLVSLRPPNGRRRALRHAGGYDEADRDASGAQDAYQPHPTIS